MLKIIAFLVFFVITLLTQIYSRVGILVTQKAYC